MSSSSSAPSASVSRSRVRAPDERDDVVAAREHPGDRELGDGRAFCLGEPAQRLHEREVALEVLAREAGRRGAEVVRGERRRPLPRPVTGEQAAGEDAVGGEADPELAAGGQDLVLDPARDERVLDLQVGDGVHRVRARIVSAPTSESPTWRT